MKTILLVDDELIIGMAEANMLRGHGFEVVLAGSGEKAVKAVRENQAIDLVLMDIDLGKGIDGTEAAQQILKSRDIPILFLSSHTEKEIVEKTEKITSYGYVVKNSGDVVLLASIKMAFKLHEAYRREKAKEAALQESEARFRAAFESAAVGMALTATDGRFLLVNRALCEMLGYTREEMQNSNFNALTLTEDLLVSRQSAERMLSGARHTDHFIKRYVHKGGRIVWADLSICLLRDEAGAPHSFIAHIQDITDQRRAEEALRESEEIMRYIVKNDPIAIIVLDQDLRFVAVSDRYLQMYNINGERVLGRQFFEAFPDLPQGLHDVARRCLAGAVERNDDEIFLLPDGSVIHNRWECRPWFRANGETGGVIVYIEDTTESKNAEAKLGASEAELRMLFGALTDVVFVIDANGRYEKIAPTQTDLLYRPPDALLGRTLHEVFPRHTADMFLAKIHAALETKQTQRFEYSLTIGDREEWFDAACTPVSRGSVYWVARAITRRKEMEQRLSDSERLYRTLVEGMNDAVMQVDNDDTITFVNRQFCELTGFSKEEVLGKTGYTLLFDPDEQRIIREQNASRIAGNSNIYEIQLRRKDGSSIWVRISGSPVHNSIGAVVGSIGVMADITERRRTEEEARQSERRFSTVFSAMPIGVSITTLRDGEFVDVNTAVIALLGYAREEIIGRTSLELDIWVDPNDRHYMARLVNEKGRAHQFETRFRRKDGKVRTVLFSSEVIEVNNERCILGIMHDISDRKRAEEELRQSEETFRQLVENTGEGIGIVSPDETFQFANKAAEAIFGVGPGELVGRSLQEFHDAAEWSRVESETALRKRGVRSVYESALTLLNGEKRTILITATPRFDSAGTFIGTFGVFRDITERAHQEEQKAQSLLEKEVLLRELQHRVKNNLNIVSGLLGLEISKLTDDRSRQVFLDARGRIRSMARLYEQLYSSASFVSVDMRVYVQDLAHAVFNTYRVDSGRIRLSTNLAAVELDMKRAVPLGLILNELITNTLKYAFPAPMQGELRITLDKPGDDIMLTVSDDGIGLPQDFDPRTPKSMGLALVRMLSEQIDAKLGIEGTNGTKIFVRFRL